MAGARRLAGRNHAIRRELSHTSLTRLREAGMALEAVQARAGHSRLSPGGSHLQLADDRLAAKYRKAAEVIDAQVFAIQPVAPDAMPGSRR